MLRESARTARVPSLRLTLLSALVIATFSSSGFAQSAPPPEYKWWALNVKAYEAHNLIGYPTGVTAPSETKGKGITLGILDTGVSRHTEYSTRLLKGYDHWNTSGDGTNDLNGHGTHVAGIAGAGLNGAGIAGIAPEASILPLRVLDANGSGSSSSLDAGVRWAINNHVKPVSGVPTQRTVFNLSLGASTPFGLTTLQSIRNAGTIAVVAAGNDGARNPGYPARYATDASVAGWILAVGAVDSNNRIASWSNRAGDTRNYYLVAPGVQIDSTYPSGTYAIMSGTSMATPAVSGAAAVVWGAWPYLTGDKVVNSLLWSATDLGDKGVDSVYGWGLLNLQAALQPIGESCVPTSTNSCGSTTTSPGKGGGGGVKTKSFATPAAAGAAAMTTDARVVGYDTLGRHFQFSAAALLRPGGVSVAQNLTTWMAATQPVSTGSGSGGRRFAYQGDSLSGTGAFSFAMPAGAGQLMMFSGASMMPFGVSHSGYRATAFTGDDALKISYLGLVEAPTGFAYDTALSDTVGLRMGYVAASSAHQFVAPGPTDLHTRRVAGGAAVGDLSARFGRLELIGTVGSLNENGAFLGARSTEQFSMRGATAFGGIAAVYEIDHQWSALANFNYGSSRGLAGDGDASYRLSTQSLSVGLLRNALFGERDRLSFAAVLPSRVVSGDVTLRAAVDVNLETGAPVYGNVPVSLSPRGQEQRYELNWSTPMATGSMGVTMMHRVQPNHDPLARAETIVGLRWVRTLR